MAIPLAYNLRNLVVRKTTTLMTALGIALTVAVLLAILALVTGLRTTLSASGDPLQVLVMRKGSESELVSNFTRTGFQDLKFKEGIARKNAALTQSALRPATINGMAGFVRREPDGTLDTVAIETRDGQIVAIYLVRNPDKLRHVSF